MIHGVQLFYTWCIFAVWLPVIHFVEKVVWVANPSFTASPIEGDWKHYVPRMVATCSIHVPWVYGEASARTGGRCMCWPSWKSAALSDICWCGNDFFQPCPSSQTGPWDPWGGRHLDQTSYHRPATCTFQIFQFQCLKGDAANHHPWVSSPFVGLGFSDRIMRQSSSQLILGSKN